MATMAILDIITKWFSNSESTYQSDHVLIQSDLPFRSRCGLKIYGHHVGHLWYWNRMTLAILNLYVALMPPIKFQLNPTYGLGGDVVWRIWRWPRDVHLGYRNGMILAILNLHVSPVPPIKFWLNLTYHLGADVLWRFSRWLPFGPSLISERYNFSSSESPCCSDASH